MFTASCGIQRPMRRIAWPGDPVSILVFPSELVLNRDFFLAFLALLLLVFFVLVGGRHDWRVQRM